MSHAPLLVGTLVVLGLAGMFAYSNPSPGALSSGHASLEGVVTSCSVCHAEGGLDAGCLSCHDEIAGQLREQRGYHHELCGKGTPDCGRCHPEHHGRGFGVMEAVAWPEEDFKHGHVEYTLDGAHDALSCDACHKKAMVFADQTRAKSYMGLAQGCVSCHEDVHEGSLYVDCLKCHDQEKFSPTTNFDHETHFPLAGAHQETDCKGCHVLDQGLSYHKVRGKACRECHEDPHRTDWKKDCDACHRTEEPKWSGAATLFNADLHRTTGFVLDKPHGEVACEGCHTKNASYDKRFAAPGRKQDNCAACHADAHEGQFGQRACRECHTRTHFQPAQYSLEDHKTYPLVDAHAGAECKACHKVEAKVRRFVGTPRSCAKCHDDPHSGQFKEASCSACHGEKSFTPPRYGLKEHVSYALTGAHEAVACVSCHTSEPGKPRRFVGTPRSCKECHDNPHGNQFAAEQKRGDCTTCHRSDAATFDIRPFDHAKKANYALEGVHALEACTACHTRPRKDAPRTYRGTPTRCDACHTDVHRGQLAPKRCDVCHTTGGEWRIRRFDHDRETRFPLDKTHATVACSACHPGVKQRDGTSVVQFKPVGKECRDCHDFKKR